MSWYKVAVDKFIKQYYKELISTVLFIALLIIYHLIFGDKFESELICQLPDPGFTLRMLSGLVFVTFGRLLYYLKLYYILYIILVVLLRQRQLYDDLKKVIWYIMMFLFGFVVAPWIIDQLNKLFSIVCNIPLFLGHLFPPYGLSLVAFFIFIFILIKTKK